MRKNCDCYRIESKRKYTYNPITRGLDRHDITVGVCWGTKEMDECSCDGDRTKCDFYPEVREKAIREENSLIVTYDCCSPDAPTLCVARKDGNKVKVLNTIQGDEAFGMYYYLTGWAELKEKEVTTNADKIRSMNDEELAEFLTSFHNGDMTMDEICHTGLCLEDEDCISCTLKWLQKSIKE